jgi:hypothetical protein
VGRRVQEVWRGVNGGGEKNMEFRIWNMEHEIRKKEAADLAISFVRSAPNSIS